MMKSSMICRSNVHQYQYSQIDQIKGGGIFWSVCQVWDRRELFKWIWRETLKERKKLLERPRHRQEDSIKIHPKEIDWRGEDWIHQRERKNQWKVAVSTTMNPPLPSKMGNLLAAEGIVGF